MFNGSLLMPLLDVFVAKVNPSGTGLVYCGYIGGWVDDICRYRRSLAIDSRKVDLSPDGLLAVKMMGYWPSVFSGYRGVIDAKGQGQAAIHIPNLPALIGVRLHSAFVTLDPAAPSGVRSISNTSSFSITR